MTSYRVVPDAPPSRLIPWLVAAALGSLILTTWLAVRPEPVGFRRACEAQGGVVVRLEAGQRLCLWAGAIIPVTPP